LGEGEEGEEAGRGREIASEGAGNARGVVTGIGVGITLGTLLPLQMHTVTSLTNSWYHLKINQSYLSNKIKDPRNHS
jgi:hypothetical protein